MLKLAIQENPVNPANAVFDYLADFIDQATNEDKHFAIFPYALSEYVSVEDLPPLIDNVENLPK